MGKLIEECKEPQDSYDILGGLYEAMNSPAARTGGRYKDVRYFNGGLFSEPARVELYPDEIAQLREAARADWSKVDPHIFGALFQDSMDAEERHAFGAHYTSPVDIMKIVGPTIVKPWKSAIDDAKSPRKLLDLFERLTTLQVLDPACGSGNFLYMAYREMKRLESQIRQRLRDDFSATQAPLIHVNARQFHGLDINPFAIELAKVTMMIGRKLAIDELGFGDEAMPRYIACSAVMKRSTFVFLSSKFLPTNALKVFAFPDDYSFGILQSGAHWLWFTTKCSKLTERFRYTPESVFDTFPWPQSPTRKQIDTVAQAGREIRRVRTEALKVLDGGLRALYRTLELPGRHPLKDAHAALDEATLAAYGFSPKQDLLAQLLDLNHTVAAKEKANEKVTAPGIPPTYGPDTDALVTEDCILP